VWRVVAPVIAYVEDLCVDGKPFEVALRCDRIINKGTPNWLKKPPEDYLSVQ
jgi:hypothetical protein